MPRIIQYLSPDPELVLIVFALPGVIALVLCPLLVAHMRGRLKRRGLRFQFALGQWILIPLVLTPGLALMSGDGSEASQVLGGILFVNAILGTALGWVVARSTSQELP